MFCYGSEFGYEDGAGVDALEGDALLSPAALGDGVRAEKMAMAFFLIPPAIRLNRPEIENLQLLFSVTMSSVRICASVIGGLDTPLFVRFNVIRIYKPTAITASAAVSAGTYRKIAVVGILQCSVNIEVHRCTLPEIIVVMEASSFHL